MIAATINRLQPHTESQAAAGRAERFRASSASDAAGRPDGGPASGRWTVGRGGGGSAGSLVLGFIA